MYLDRKESDMHSRITRMLVAVATMATLAGGPVATTALARPHHHVRHHAVRASQNQAADPGENGSEAQGREADNDAAQQAAACQKAGVDPNGSNVQYDDQTGTCTGGGANSQQQQ